MWSKACFCVPLSKNLKSLNEDDILFFMHAVINDERMDGRLTDFKIECRQVKEMFTEYSRVAFKSADHFAIGEEKSMSSSKRVLLMMKLQKPALLEFRHR